MEAKIRQMRKTDVVEVSKVFMATYQQEKHGGQWTLPSAKKFITYWFERQPDLSFVAVMDKKIVGGFMAAIKPLWNGNHLSDGEIFVHPDYQKMGIASLLSIRLYEKALKKYHVIGFEAYTFKKAKFPLSWYLSQGFSTANDWVMIYGDVKTLLKNLKARQKKK